VRFDAAYREFAETIGVPVVVSDDDGTVVIANAAAVALFSGLLGDPDLDLQASQTRDHPWRLLHEDGRDLRPDEIPGDLARRTGQPVRDRVVGMVVGAASPRWVMQSAVPVERDDRPGRHHVVSTFVDITARRELEARLEQRASHDALTGLSNRLRFEERLRESAARADRAAEPLALLLIDVDDFKGCNDLFGHAAGDAVLVALADRTRERVRSTDTVARIGGDEFAVVLDGADQERAAALAADLVDALARPVGQLRALRGRELATSVSIGIAVRAPGAPLAELSSAADEALFAAKHAGKGTFVVHDPLAVRPTLAITVRAEDAAAWAGWTRSLRTEIEVRKSEGRLPDTAGAPDSVHRTLQELLRRIDRLPPTGTCDLPLPRERDLAPFVFHHTSAMLWVDQLRRRGVIEAAPGAAAERFWTEVCGALAVAEA
jgi:diguanylate cyclase (GGDEF)-like protein